MGATSRRDAGRACASRRDPARGDRETRRPCIQDGGRRVLRGVRAAVECASRGIGAAAGAARRTLAGRHADPGTDGAARGRSAAARRRLFRTAAQRGGAIVVGVPWRTDAVERGGRRGIGWQVDGRRADRKPRPLPAEGRRNAGRGMRVGDAGPQRVRAAGGHRPRLPRGARGRAVAAGARDPPQSAGRARRVRRPGARDARAGAAAGHRGASHHRAGAGGHAARLVSCAATRSAWLGDWPGGVCVLRPERGEKPRGHHGRGCRRARRSALRCRRRGSARPRDRRARALPGASSTTSSRCSSTPPRRSGAGSSGRPTRSSSSPAASACTCRARRSFPSSRCRWTRTRSTCSSRARRLSGRTSRSARPTATMSAASSACSTGCRWRSSSPRRG